MHTKPTTSGAEERKVGPAWRVGEGHDLHRLGSGRKLILGGVDIPHHQGAIGHSDADVVFHAITDALLGSVAAGDIGELFPNTDPAFRDADSLQFVEEAHRRVRQAGYEVVNLDCTIFLESPKLSPHKGAIRERIAGALQLDLSLVNVKAKSGEAVDAVGRQEAVAASVIVLVERKQG